MGLGTLKLDEGAPIASIPATVPFVIDFILETHMPSNLFNLYLYRQVKDNSQQLNTLTPSAGNVSTSLSAAAFFILERNVFLANNVFLNLRDVVTCQSTDLSFLLAVFLILCIYC